MRRTCDKLVFAFSYLVLVSNVFPTTGQIFAELRRNFRTFGLNHSSECLSPCHSNGNNGNSLIIERNSKSRVEHIHLLCTRCSWASCRQVFFSSSRLIFLSEIFVNVRLYLSRRHLQSFPSTQSRKLKELQLVGSFALSLTSQATYRNQDSFIAFWGKKKNLYYSGPSFVFSFFELVRNHFDYFNYS